MSRISYFQRFSQKENHATNNTMLILRHFYQYAPQKLEAVLSSLVDDDLDIGLSFEQQIQSAGSIPDGRISQKPLEIYFETKRGDTLDKDQIARHIESITSTRTHSSRTILFGLTRTPISQADKETLKALSKEITFVPITFADVVSALRDVCEDFEPELQAVLSDFEEYLIGEDLLQIGDVMTVVPCGTSLEDNVTHRLYFEPAGRPTKARSQFIGLYTQKCVHYLASPQTVITGIQDAEGFHVTGTELGQLDADERDRIKAVIEACTYFPDFAKKEHRYYLFENVCETDIKKSSKGGIWGPRVFNLSNWLDYSNPSQSYTVEEAAKLLSGKVFE